MSAKPKKAFSLDEIAKRFDAIKKRKPDGKIAFGPIHLFEDLQTVLVTALIWDENISSDERANIARQATFAAGEQGQITKEPLLKEIHALEANRLKAPSTRYLVVTTLSVKHGNHLKVITLDKIRFSFHERMPKHVDRRFIETGTDASRLSAAIPKEYTVVCGKVSAKSPGEAVTRVLTALDFLRGIWNYMLNQRVYRQMTFGGGRWKPINKIRLGPLHTVHSMNGKPASNLWWEEPYFYHDEAVDLKNEWAGTKGHVAWLRQRSRLLPYAADLWKRYVRALDRSDFEMSFLSLWSLLELLTATSGERYDETIKRTLFICEDRELHRLILEHLRDCRNSKVHRDESQSQLEHHVFQLKYYVETLLHLHMVWAGELKNLSDVGEFLSLPAEPQSLRHRRRLMAKALTFLRKSPKRKPKSQ